LQGISYIKAFSRLFYPVTCASCGEALVDRESHICTVCQLSLPSTGYHNNAVNPMDDLLKLRLRVDFISAFLYYDKGLSTQNMLRSIKYKGNKLLAMHLGELYGYEIKDSFDHYPDLIIPVPLHKRKQRERGYNQSEYWANGLTKILNSPTDTHSLIRMKYTTTQTKKSRTERIKNVEDAFMITNPEFLKGKSVLLVDDVITTGATLEACGQKLWSSGIRSLNIATIAFAAK
jgi:ComF family protein